MRHFVSMLCISTLLLSLSACNQEVDDVVEANGIDGVAEANEADEVLETDRVYNLDLLERTCEQDGVWQANFDSRNFHTNINGGGGGGSGGSVRGGNFSEYVFELPPEGELGVSMSYPGGTYLRITDTEDPRGWKDWHAVYWPSAQDNKDAPRFIFCEDSGMEAIKYAGDGRIAGERVKRFVAFMPLGAAPASGPNDYRKLEYWIDLNGRPLRLDLDLRKLSEGWNHRVRVTYAFVQGDG